MLKIILNYYMIAIFKCFNNSNNILTDISKTNNNSTVVKLRYIKVWINSYIGRNHQDIILLDLNKIQIFKNKSEITDIKQLPISDIESCIIKLKKNDTINIANPRYSNKFNEYLKQFLI